MSLNLVRNSRVLFTTNISTATGAVVTTGALAANTFELQVLDGFSFSQTTNSETVSISEAGSTPNRGSRSFNTSLAPVDFSFTTYIRPSKPSTVVAEEQVLWNALLGATAISTATSLGTVSSITRASTAAAVTIVGTGLASGALPAGTVFTMGGIGGTLAHEWNTPILVSSASATTIIGSYLTAPSTGTAPGALGTPTYQKSAWTVHPAVAADTAKPGAYALVTAANSGVNQLQPFGLVVAIDGATYLLDNCALNQAQIDFGLDGIASIQWSGNGTAIRTAAATTFADSAPNTTLTGGFAGVALLKNTTANYITNKLSTIALASNIGGVSGTTYNLAITGGSLVINNNIGYITPANLGVVNVPIGYYTGNLSISGNVTAYLHSGSTPANNTGTLLSNILSNVATAAETKYRMQLDVGGSGATTTHVEIELDGASISVPTIETQQIVSTTINFNAQGTSAVLGDNTYDITASNQIQVRYFSA
jgi:hypothetical protein